MKPLNPYQKKFIELMIQHDALQFGEFTLKSGRISPYFFNMGKLCTGQALAVLGECYAAAIEAANMEFDGLFGPAYKGIPLASAVAIELVRGFNRDVPYSFNRKEKKDHGEGGSIVGAPLQGNVLIIDDVMTAGTAVREAVGIIQLEKANVAGIIIALDRQERGQGELSAVQEVQKFYNIPVISVIQLAHIIEYLNSHPEYQTLAARVQAYREEYGV